MYALVVPLEVRGRRLDQRGNDLQKGNDAMKMKWSVLFGVVCWLVTASVFTAAQGSENKAWERVDSLSKQSVEDFLKKFPHGKHAQAAELSLALLTELSAIREKKLEPTCTIPFVTLGQKWESWQGAAPEKGAIMYRADTGNKCDFGDIRIYFVSERPLLAGGGSASPPFAGGKTPGLGEIRLVDGVVASPTGDGSIIVFETDGLECGFLGGVTIQTPEAPGNRMFFGVLQGIGLVHLSGAGKVTLPDGKVFDLK